MAKASQLILCDCEIRVLAVLAFSGLFMANDNISVLPTCWNAFTERLQNDHLSNKYSHLTQRHLLTCRRPNQCLLSVCNKLRSTLPHHPMVYLLWLEELVISKWEKWICVQTSVISGRRYLWKMLPPCLSTSVSYNLIRWPIQTCNNRFFLAACWKWKPAINIQLIQWICWICHIYIQHKTIVFVWDLVSGHVMNVIFTQTLALFRSLPTPKKTHLVL